MTLLQALSSSLHSDRITRSRVLFPSIERNSSSSHLLEVGDGVLEPLHQMLRRFPDGRGLELPT